MDYPFTSDGCSGGMSWLWRFLVCGNPPWEGDCVAHDRAYWEGGTAKQRRAADRDLLIKVAQRGYAFIAVVMWLGVRIGGHPLLPTSWRWGYGWKWPRNYSSKETSP